jgi:2-polyprenyl-3-methyl-5-hydroxy-6-metoxy-1,4-benzoquinol methylase
MLRKCRIGGSTPEFDEDLYLAAHPDVRAAVAVGSFSSGLAHYLRFGKNEGRALRERVIQSLAELDEEIARLRDLEQRSFSDWLRARSAFRMAEDLSRLPANPLSPEYRAAQTELYYELAGVHEYNPWRAEPIPISVPDSVDPHPFPFSTRDAELIGGHFVALGHILRTLWSLRPGGGHRILEYGCGTGFTTIMLAASGYEMTAVDINASALRVIDALAERRGLAVTTFNGEFGDAPAGAALFEFVLFYEAFHHAFDFVSLLEKLHARVTPGGAVLFAGEPVFPDFPKPWGVRLDGASVWEIRTKGWLELGFREDFFLDLLGKTGWSTKKVRCSGSPDIYIAQH